MKALFWICWMADVIIIITFSLLLVKSYLNGNMDHNNKGDAIDHVLLFSGSVSLVVGAIVLHYHQWPKAALLLASMPFLVLLFIVLMPIIAYISGARMN